MRTVTLCARLYDHVEWSFGGAPDVRKSGFTQHLGWLHFAYLRAEGGAYFLTKRCRDADAGRKGIVNPTDWIDIVLKTVSRKRLNDHKCSVFRRHR